MGAWSRWRQAVSERSPEGARWLVRVFRNESDRKAQGAGVLVDEHHVLTCAHVAAPRGSPPPARVWIDFPFVAPGERQEATLAPDGWEPEAPDGRGDLALFDLAAAPDGAIPAPLRRPGRVSRHAFRAYGFPPGHPDGDWTSGVILGPAGPGHVQLEVEQGHVIEGGFSGAPVWDDSLRAVIGLVATAEPGARRSFLIPVDQASRRWPDALEGWVGWRASQDDAFLGHWLDRSLGSTVGGERDDRPVSLFCGQDEAIRELNRWLEAPPEGRVKVVTGLPGTGKSALLSRLIVLADPTVRQRLGLTDAEIAAAPRSFAFDVAVHARQRSLAEVASAIAQATGTSLDIYPEEWSHPDETSARAVEAIAGASRGRDGMLTIAVDALDETDNPHALARLLLEPLARSDGVRVVVATRPGDGDNLLRALGADRSRAMVLHDPPWFSLEHLASYARATLKGLPGSSHGGQAEQLLTEVAAAVAARAAPSYLVAGLTARTLARSAVVDRTQAGWQKRFPAEVDQAMSAYLDSLADPRTARELLLPLAYARGTGLPADGRLWARLAATLTGRPYVMGDIASIRRTAADYLMEEVGRIRPTIRLFHQALADALLHDGRDQRADEADIARALHEPQPEDPRLLPDDGYRRAHLADHAASGDLLDDYVIDPGVLVSAEPPRLLAALTAAPPRRRLARRWADVYEYAAPRFSTDPGTNTSYLEQATMHIAPELTKSVDRLDVKRPFRTLWASPRSITPHRTLSGHQGWVNALAVGSVGGKTLVVGGGDDGTVRVWDPERRDAEPAELRGHEGSVNAVAVGSVGGRTLVVSGGYDGTVRLWDPERRDAEPAELRGHEGSVLAVAVGSVGERMLVVSVDAFRFGSTVRLWDPERPDADPAELRAHEGPLHDVAVGSVGGRTLVVSVGFDGIVRLWDPERPDAEPAVLRGHEGPAYAVAVGSAGGRALVVSDGDDGTVWLWDPERPDAEPAELRGHEGPVLAVTVGSVGGRTLVVSGGGDGTVRLWKTNGRPVGVITARGRPTGLAPGPGGSFALSTERGIDLVCFEG